MVAHADLTGVDLHEPKGVESATAGTVYVSNGSGSGTWQVLTPNSIDQTSILNINKFSLSVTFPDVGTASSIFIPVGVDCTLVKITSALQDSIAGSNTVLTVYNYGGVSMGTITLAYNGSAGGDLDSLQPVSNNTFVAGTFVKISTDGATSSTDVNAILTLDFEYA